MNKHLSGEAKREMGCKADGADETAAALAAVRISSNRPTRQTAPV